MARKIFSIVGVFLVGMLSVTASARGDKPTRFVAVLADGTRLQSNTLTDWQTVSAQPRMDGKPLFDAKNPLRWLRDRGLPSAVTPRAYVETIAGDRLPGVVVGFHDGNDNPYSPSPPNFVVKPETSLQPPQNVAEPRIGIVARYVRRIVWQKRDNDQLQPGTLFYRDGRTVTFRASRFSDGQVTLLLADGQRKIFFAEIAEIHLPASDAWNAYLDELALLCPRGEGRLLQIETTDGLIATTSFERFAASGSTNANDFAKWVHGIQPAWSLDIIWVPTGNIGLRRSFAPHEVPLSRLWPVQSQQRSLLAGVGPPWRLNRNVQWGPLRCGNQEFGWGFGVHAFSELTFDLPASATAFHGSVGLDRIAGQGGCVRVRVFVNDTKSSPLFESELLVGSEKTETFKDLPLKGRQRLILQVDPAHDDRPAGADPLDIRDMTDWLDPLVELDAAGLKKELQARVPKLLAAWTGWTLILDQKEKDNPADTIEWTNVRDENSKAPGTFRLGCMAKNKPLVLEREVKVGSEPWLTMMAFQPVNTGQITKLEVQVNDDLVQEFSLPVLPRGVAEPPPMAVSLRGYAGHAIKLRLTQMPPPTPAPILWRFVRFVDQLPTLFQGVGGKSAAIQAAASEMDVAKRAPTADFANTSIVVLGPGEQRNITWQHPIAIREMPQLGEFRWVQYTVRKSKAGLFAIEFHDTNGRDKPIRADGGVGTPAYGSALRVWADPNSEQWITIERDLFGDFGKSDITGLTLSCVAGKFVEFDTLFFGRGREDFELVPKVSLAFQTPQHRLDILKSAVERTVPATVLLEFEDGRKGNGIIINDAGTILTAGHLLVAPNKNVKIYVNEGPPMVGKTKGICRDLDVGMVKFVGTPHRRHNVPHVSNKIPERLYYLGIAQQRSATTTDKPLLQVVDFRRVFHHDIWTDFDPPDALAGGPLVDQHARTIGIQSRRDPFGGFIYTRVSEVVPLLPRLEKGEVFGAWPRGAEPEMGLTAKIESTGVVIQTIASASAAEKAGLMPNDIIIKLNDRPIATLADLSRAVAEKNPGDSVTVEYQRDGKTKNGTITLMPRVP